jgi:hypothetical protein
MTSTQYSLIVSAWPRLSALAQQGLTRHENCTLEGHRLP